MFGGVAVFDHYFGDGTEDSCKSWRVKEFIRFAEDRAACQMASMWSTPSSLSVSSLARNAPRPRGLIVVWRIVYETSFGLYSFGR
jgi:hypothetical protein